MLRCACMHAAKAVLLAALLAGPQVVPHALAAPHEINVFTDEIEAPGEVGVELHVNYARGRATPDYPGELPPDRVWRVMPEIVFGLRRHWEMGLHLPTQRDAEGRLHADGLRLRLKHAWPREESSACFAGINVEWSYDEPHLSQDRHGLELRGILGWRTEHWLVAVNPILAWVLKGPNKSRKPDLEGSAKIARKVGGGWAVGIEHYVGFGPLSDWAPRTEQDRMLYFVADYEGRSWSLNLGFGAGLTPASDDKVVKAIIGIPFR